MAKVIVDGNVAEPEEIDVVEDEAEIVEGESDGEGEGDEQEELVVQIGDAEPEEDEAAKAPQWVRDLRKRARDLERENRELKAGKEPEPEQLGSKPTRESCDYDDDEYDRQLEAWYERKRETDAAEQRRKDAEREQATTWQGKLSRYAEGRTTLGAKDYEDAETHVVDTLTVTQQGIIVQGADNPALVTYALGKNPSRLKELAAIADPIEFAFAVSKLEVQLKVKDRNNPPPPEKSVRGASGASLGGDTTLDKLRAEAAKTGDYSKVVAYRRQKKTA